MIRAYRRALLLGSTLILTFPLTANAQEVSTAPTCCRV